MIALAVVCAGGVARAQGLEISLQGVGDACVSAEGLRARVVHYAGGGVVGEGVSVRVEYRGVEGAEFVVVRGDAEVARRVFEELPAECGDRRDTLAVALAVAVVNVVEGGAADGGGRGIAEGFGGAQGGVVVSAGVGGAGVASQAGEQQDDAVPQDEPVPQDEEVQQHAEVQQNEHAHEDGHEDLNALGQEDAGARAFVIGGVRLASGLLPEGALLFGAGADFRIWRAIRLEFGGFVSLPQRSGLVGATVRTMAFGGEVLGCGELLLGVVGGRGCVGLGAALVDAQGEQFFEDFGAQMGWLAALARLGVRWPVDAPLALEVVGGVHANLVRPRMQVADFAAAEALTGVVGFSFGLDVSVALP
ncbi:MAG TPA: hypothetical protein VJV78_48920 [Polyangiales bacterium]|nr:hypothetical protein [Polyangiales bacterium]